MSFTLGAITLPYPKSFTRSFIETGADNLLMEGKSTRRVENRKEQFTLVFQNLTPAQVGSIMSEYNLEEVRDFTVSEINLAIPATRVLIDVSPRNYPKSGGRYREDFTLILREVI